MLILVGQFIKLMYKFLSIHINYICVKKIRFPMMMLLGRRILRYNRSNSELLHRSQEFNANISPVQASSVHKTLH